MNQEVHSIRKKLMGSGKFRFSGLGELLPTQINEPAISNELPVSFCMRAHLYSHSILCLHNAGEKQDFILEPACII